MPTGFKLSNFDSFDLDLPVSTLLDLLLLLLLLIVLFGFDWKTKLFELNNSKELPLNLLSFCSQVFVAHFGCY